MYSTTSHNTTALSYVKKNLSPAHRKMLLEESGLDPEIVAGRGYYSARRLSEVPDCFQGSQRRLGLVIPARSPDEESTGYQLRPNKPRKGGPKYLTPAGISPVVDVHPRMLEEVRHGDKPLLITEGAKTGDSATGRGIPTVVLAGVWLWCVPKVKPYRLKPCFDHIRLKGRRVNVAFDSDCMTKPGVQDALAALVKALEERGADVWVIYLPDAADGSKQGIDDYLVAGGTVKEMFMLARKFEPEDFGRIRLSRNKRLRLAVEDLLRRWWLEEWKGRGGHSERDVALKLIQAAARSGKIHADGIRVQVSWGVLQVESKVARRTLAKALSRLEERGLLYRDNEGRKAGKSGTFVLRARVDQYGERATQETQELQACDPGGLPLRALFGAPDVPRLRWSRPAFMPKRGTVSGTRKVRESKPLAARECVERLGKIRGAVVDALEVAGGEMSLQELSEVLNRKRPRDVRRRIIPMLEEAGIIECEADVVRLARDWRESLEAAREAGGELEADDLDEDRRKRKSRAYRERHKAPTSSPSPSPAGLEAVERSREMREEHIAEHEEHEAAARAAELERKKLAKRFVYERVKALGCVRLGLLQTILNDAGYPAFWALPAARSLGCTVERLPECEDAEFVFAPPEWREVA